MKLFWHRTEEAFKKLYDLDRDNPHWGVEMHIQHTRLQLMLLSAIADALWATVKGKQVSASEEYLRVE